MSIVEAAEKYFSSINSMASRMYCDIRETRSAYDKVWPTLSHEEQSEIINECIIKPEISIQYMKYVRRDHGDVDKKLSSDSFRDEHAAPFNFKTSSQLNLRLFENEEKVKPKPKKEAPKPVVREEPVETSPQMTPHYKVDVGIFSKIMGRNPSLDSELEVLVSPISTATTSTTVTSDIPKTGLDFLDNW